MDASIYRYGGTRDERRRMMIGFILGLFVGTLIGIAIIAMCSMSDD